MYSLKDSIVALATSPGRGALNVVRVSGSDSLSSLFVKLTKKSRLPSPNSSYQYLIYSKKNIIDQSVIAYFKAPKSFTGENMLEISVHGGYVVANQVIELILNTGCRMASPGEFTYRAFVNNKISLIQAEAINSIISSENTKSSNLYVKNLTGGLSRVIDGLLKEVKDLLVLAEHEIDFSEEEITLTTKKEYLKILNNIYLSVASTIKNSCYEEFKEEPRIVIVGRPNAGKSSLFNKIVGYEKAIVTNIKGTTRDVIEARVTLKGQKILLADTAGIRTTKKKLEKLGIEKTQEELKRGYLFIVLDEENPLKIVEEIKKIRPRALCFAVINKIDKKKNTELFKNIDYKISCKNNSGIEGLLTGLSTAVEKYYVANYQSREFLVNERQSLLLSSIKKKTGDLIQEYENHGDLVLFASALRNILNDFETLSRPVDQNEILNEIFGGFCVGK